MVETILLEESYVKLSYLPEKKTVLLVWNGTFTKEQYQNAFIASLEFQQKAQVPVFNFLSDTRKQGMVNPENRKWFESYALPMALKQGLKRGGVVFDGSVFKKYYLNLILQASNKFKFPFRLFNSLEEAITWFDSFND